MENFLLRGAEIPPDAELEDGGGGRSHPGDQSSDLRTRAPVEGPAAFLCECDQLTCPATTIMLDPSDFEGIVASAAERLVGQAMRHRAWSSSASKAATSSSSRPRP